MYVPDVGDLCQTHPKCDNWWMNSQWFQNARFFLDLSELLLSHLQQIFSPTIQPLTRGVMHGESPQNGLTWLLTGCGPPVGRDAYTARKNEIHREMGRESHGSWYWFKAFSLGRKIAGLRSLLNSPSSRHSTRVECDNKFTPPLRGGHIILAKVPI